MNLIEDGTIKQAAVVIDIDNTLALLNGRNPYAGHECATDTPCEATRWLLRQIGRAHSARIIYLTGRNESAREATENWLARQGLFGWDELFMRATDDWSPAHEYKLRVMQESILPLYSVIFALDDDDRVVSAFRSIGITCWHSRERLDHPERSGEDER